MSAPEQAGAADGIPRPGDVVDGKYRIDREIGAGGMGVVVAGVHLALRQTVAIKFMRPKHARDGDALKRFLREARAAALMKSEHATRIHDVGATPEGVPFIVMELLEGRNLDEIASERGRLPIGEAVDYVLQACEALAEAHAVGIVHRDLKPSNLFLAERPGRAPTLKVLDFGISKSLAANDDLPAVTSLTAPNTVLGSPQYMSPEQVRNSKDVDARADVWALGVIAYELLAGRPPFDADSLPHMYAMIVSGDAVPLRKARPELPAALCDAVMRCLVKEPIVRMQDVGELARALRPFALEGGRGSVAPIANVREPTLAVAARSAARPPSKASLELAPTLAAPASPARGAWIAAAALIGAAAIAVYVGTRRESVGPERSMPATASAIPVAASVAAATASASSASNAPPSAAMATVDASPAATPSVGGAAAPSMVRGPSAAPSSKVRDLKTIQLME